jgi:hypothetical protein
MHKLMLGTDHAGSFVLIVRKGQPWPLPEDDGTTR